MPVRLLFAIALLAILLPVTPAQAAQTSPSPSALPEELVLSGDNIITLWLNGEPLRMEVSADSFGAPIINSEVAARLALIPTEQRGWRFGPVVVQGLSAVVAADFGAGPAPMLISWAERFATRKADGVIGVHNLPYARVTFALGNPASAGETVQRFVLKRSGGRADTRLGTEVVVGKQRLTMVFAHQRAENLVTAPTANFIATHQDGGFEAQSDGIAVMNFAVERPTRMMRIATPILLGELVVDRFAVRVEDYGEPRRVGEIGENDPRFAPGNITVSRRKGRGKPDLLTRIGRDQIAHCSSLTYDLEASEIRLSCATDGS
jgi:hypothetical protein